MIHTNLRDLLIDIACVVIRLNIYLRRPYGLRPFLQFVASLSPLDMKHARLAPRVQFGLDIALVGMRLGRGVAQQIALVIWIAIHQLNL